MKLNLFNADKEKPGRISGEGKDVIGCESKN